MPNRIENIRPRTVVTATIVIFLLAGGFAHAQGVVLPLPPTDQQKINTQLGSGINSSALPSNTIGDVTAYFPLRTKDMTYRVTSGPNSGNTQMLGVAETRRPNGHLAWRFQLSPILAGFINQTPQGDLIMPAVTDAGEGVVVITTPGNPFVLKGMRPCETRSSSQQVSVLALDNPSDQEYSGTLNGAYPYVGNHQVRVPAGTFNAILFRLSCNGKVGPVQTKDTAYYFSRRAQE